MPRIPYVFPAPGESPIADKLRERRKDGKLISLDGVFLNAPAIAAGYSSLMGAIRQGNSLDGGLRELLVSLVVKVERYWKKICLWMCLDPACGSSQLGRL